MTLRDLRVWHWFQSQRLRKLQREQEKKAETRPRNAYQHRRAAKYHENNANHHLAAVQALNDVVEGSVHQDYS